MDNSHRFFENRECRYYPCHKGMDEINCLFCYCPMYHSSVCPGEPRYITRGDRTIKVCTDCSFPHRAENYDEVIRFLREDI